METPFEKYDGIKVQGIDRVLCVTDMRYDSLRDRFIVIAEDIHTGQKVEASEHLCVYEPLSQLDIFEYKKNKEKGISYE